jgi:imidazolonepropionase-like amidohydrolase
MRDAAYGVTTEAEARRDVDELAAKRPDMIKIWVDDRNGTVEKLRPALSHAIIEEAHKHGIRVMAHINALDDAKDLVRAGVDGFAHVVRDKDVDQELLDLLKEHRNVFFLETLWGERRVLYRGKPKWLEEPLLRETLATDEVNQLADSFASMPSDVAERARESGDRLLRNVAALHAAGVQLGLGTDTGGVSGGQYFGLASHVELELLTHAGFSPTEAIVAATRTTAEILALADAGTIAPGKSADFIVLDANPLDSIGNTRGISTVYLRGKEIDRPALRARWTH